MCVSHAFSWHARSQRELSKTCIPCTSATFQTSKSEQKCAFFRCLVCHEYLQKTCSLVSWYPSRISESSRISDEQLKFVLHGFRIMSIPKKALVVLESMVNSRWKYNAGLSDSQSVSVFIKSCCNPKIQCFHFGLQELVISRPVGGKTRVVCWNRTSGHMRRRRAAFDFCSRISYSSLQRWHQAPFPQKESLWPIAGHPSQMPWRNHIFLTRWNDIRLSYLPTATTMLAWAMLKVFQIVQNLAALEWFNVPSLAFQNLRSASHTSTTVTLAKCWAGPFSEKTAGLLNSPKTKIINGIMLVIFPCPFVHVSLWRCNLETTDWIVPNPPNADGCTPVAFWGLGFGKVKALLRKPRHEHLLVGDPLNSVG